MKRIVFFLAILFAVVSSGPVCDASMVTMTSSSSKIIRGQPAAVVITYSVTGGATRVPLFLRSGEGIFTASGPTGTVLLGRNAVPIVIPINPGGSGSRSETLTIPASVIESAISNRTTQFRYERSFSAPNANPVAQRVTFQITTEATSELQIRAISLYFDNGRPEATVEKGFRGLRAYADIGYAGSGLFEGHWEVDGRIVSRVFQHLSFGGVFRLQTPDIPELPTFDPGTHRIRFVITRPVSLLSPPTMVYFVDPASFKPAYLPVTIVSPGGQAPIPFSTAQFAWQYSGNASYFLVQYGDEIGAKTVFSAYARNQSYVLPEAVLKGRFRPGRQYYWKVIAFGSDDNVLGESSVRSFFFAGSTAGRGQE